MTLLIACSEPPPSPLRVGLNPWIGYQPLNLAQELGFLEPNVARLVNLPNSTEVIRAYRNGLIDVAALTLDEVLLLKESGLEPKIILVMDVSKGADVIIAKPGYNVFQDLKGKRIGVENSALGAYVLTRALDLSGLRTTDITVVPLSLDRHLEAYQNNRIDAVVTFEPVRSQLLAIGGNEVFTSKQIPNEIVDVLVIRKEVLKSHHTLVRQLLNAWFKSLDHLKQNPQQSAEILSPFSALTAAEYLSALSFIEQPSLGENKQLLSQDNGIISSLHKLATVMLEKHLLNGELSSNDLVDAKPLGNLP